MQYAGLGDGVNASVTSSWADDKERQADVFITIR